MAATQRNLIELMSTSLIDWGYCNTASLIEPCLPPLENERVPTTYITLTLDHLLDRYRVIAMDKWTNTMRLDIPEVVTAILDGVPDVGGVLGGNARGDGGAAGGAMGGPGGVLDRAEPIYHTMYQIIMGIAAQGDGRAARAAAAAGGAGAGAGGQ
jgi:hypothetical protein